MKDSHQRNATQGKAGLLFRNVLLFEPITGSSQKEDLIYLDLV